MNALERIKLSNQLTKIIKELQQSSLSALDRIKKSNMAMKIIRQLNGEIIDDGLSDNPNDENYRYKDTGYVPGSRKELAHRRISELKKQGLNIRTQDIDWNALEEDPRLAQSLINKATILGKVDYHYLKEQGMPGSVAYFIKRLYQAVDKEPMIRDLEHQKLYVTALSELRSAFESARDYASAKNAAYELSLNNSTWNIDGIDKKTADGVYELSYETRVVCMLGKGLRKWFNNTGNKAIAEMRRGVGDDWKWLESKRSTATISHKERFQLEVADVIERVGGTNIDIESSKQLEQAFNFRAIQSGKWVLQDPDSAQFHMQNAAQSMLDMSDVIGIPPETLGLGGRLALAFGARGKGGALAHYEPVQRVINITKMRGGGSLAHEYFHALDNMIKDLSAQKDHGDARFFGTENPEQLDNIALREAFSELQEAMSKGSSDRKVNIYIGKSKVDEVISAKKYVKMWINYNYPILATALAEPDFLKSIALLDENAKNQYRFQNIGKGKRQQPWKRGRHPDYVKILKYYMIVRQSESQDVPIDENGEVEVPGFNETSKFRLEAVSLDGDKGNYWSSNLEMAARAFTSYMIDKLAEQGRKNDYLAYEGRHSARVFPQGEERTRINAAFDKLFKVIREDKILENAMNNGELMDSLFGPQTMA